MIAGGWAHPDIREDLQAMFYNYQRFADNINFNTLAQSMA